MKRAWPFLVGVFVFAYLGEAPPIASIDAGPMPNALDSGWHVASLICAGIFLGVLIGSYKR